MADLITLSDYRTFLGVAPTYTLNDPKVTGMIPYASAAVLAYTGRDFGAPVVIETRDFSYDGSGFLDIDDASTVATVTMVYPGGQTIDLDSDSWRPQPPRRDDSQIYSYIVMPDYVGQVSGSPEMGFTRNLDVYARERRSYGVTSTVRVAATWGWPVVPGDVKLATIWTIQSWIERPSGDLSAEAIEGWSRSWGRNGAAAAAQAIPERALDLLSAYTKLDV